MKRRINLDTKQQQNSKFTSSQYPINNENYEPLNDSSSTFLHNPQRFTTHGELASPQSRLIALLLDALIFGLGFGFIWIIWFITLAEKGTTPGHHLMGQVVIDVQSGTPLGWKKMVAREILLKGLLHWILGSFLFMTNYIIDGAFILTSSHRTLHDLVIGSQVIQRSNKTILRKINTNQVDDWLSR